MERLQQIEEIFHQALQREPAQREAFVRQACRDDSDLRRQVVSLLGNHEESGAPERWAAQAVAQLVDSPVSLQPGQSLGPYRIDSFLAAGGMGEVYRATDTRLSRLVAIKVSAARFSERFEREARLIASLNHPHVCHLYDVGPNYLVMEFVEGAPLRGPLSLKQAVEYAWQILDALDAAHRKGIVHRDLKPANILLTKQGVKLLDFGLARQDGALQQTDATVTAGLTIEGQIVGTLQYMSPEQLHGKVADTRSDLFSFGCVLYEILSGKCAFGGEDAASVIAAILEREPAPLNLTPPLERVIKTCLKKNPDERFQNALDLKRALTWAMEMPTAAKANRRIWIGFTAAALLLGALLGWTVSIFRQPVANESVLRLEINPPPRGQIVHGGGSGGFAISPDGGTAAYVALSNGRTGLWVRPLDGPARLLPGTENAGFPFWSPDNKSIGFVIGISKLYRIDLRAGAPVAVCDPGLIFTGGSWGSDGYILFSTLSSGIFRVPAAGGIPSPVTKVDASRGEVLFRWPQVIPGGRFLFWIESSKPENNGVYAASFARPGEHVKLLRTESNALYAPGGERKSFLLWLRGGTLVAQEFNPQTLEFAGDAQSIAEGVGASPRRQMYVTASANGLLLYGSFDAVTQLGWFDRTGKLVRALGEPVESIMNFRLSPDERYVAVQRSTRGVWDLWLIDAERGLPRRFTAGTGYHHPIWSPDGRVILYSHIGSKSVLRKAANGTGAEQVVIQRPEVRFSIADWSGDGRWALARANDSDTKFDIWVLPMTLDGRIRDDTAPKPYLRTPFNESESRFSPEPSPRWVAYQSDDSGQVEVYIDSFPESRGRKLISTGGGRDPEWGAGGRELFYVAPDDRLMAVSLKVGADTIEPSAPRELFRLPLPSFDLGRGGIGSSPYQASRDGQRFLTFTSTEAASQPLMLIVNWPALLKKGSSAP